MRTRTAHLAGALAVSLTVACTQAATPIVPGASGTPSVARPSGDIGVQGCTPARTLIPANTTDACGLRVMEAVTARLVRADTTTGAPQLDLAQSIETSDDRTFTVHLTPGRRFHDGTEVLARNFVQAWNWSAQDSHKMAGASFFDPIEGAAVLRCTTQCADPRPTQMSGLTVIDDHTFTVRTTRPATDLRTRLAHPVFAPLPDAFFAGGSGAAGGAGGADAYAARPIGAGPFRFVSASNTQVVLEAADDYAGPAPAKVRRVVVWFYDDPAHGLDAQKAYDDVVANRLDFTAVIPTDMLTDEQWKTDLKGRFDQRDTRTPTVLTFVAGDKQLAANTDLRRALSIGIDRTSLTRRVFQGTRSPAMSWVSPAVPGYTADACGDLCAFDLDRAKDLYASSGGYTGQLDVTVNADGGNKEWADALCNQLKANLGVDCQVTVLANQRAILEALEAGRLTGLVRIPQGVDHLSPEAYLAAYRRGARANFAGMRDQAYDDLIGRAGSAASSQDALQLYRQAERRLATTIPSVPLWYSATPVGWSTRVTDVQLTPFGTLDLSQVRVK